MVDEKIVHYTKEALKRGYSVDRIIKNLATVGHDKETIRQLVRQAVRERLSDLTAQKALFFDVSEIAFGHTPSFRRK